MTNIKPMQCIKEYPNEPSIVSNSNGCCEVLCIKKSSVKSYSLCKTQEKDRDRKAKKEDIAKSLKLYNGGEHLRGETLPEAQQLSQVKVMKMFL